MFSSSPKVVKQPQATGGHDDRFLHHVVGRDPSSLRKLTSNDGMASSLGKTLRQRRKALGVSVVAAAEAAHISRITWYRLEKGEPTVSLGSMLAAAKVLGIQVSLDDGQPIDSPALAAPDEWLPLCIRLSDYPALRALAWQVGNDATTLTPREAFGLYQRNWRHVDTDSLQPNEAALIRSLKDLFAGDWPDV